MKEQKIEKGTTLWIPCSVNTGPFPDERRVYVKTGIDEWFGFVSTTELERKLEHGNDRVRAFVLEVHSTYMVVGINGQSPANKLLKAEPTFAQYDTI